MSHVSYVTLFVAQAIINLTASNHDDSFNHDYYIQRNFWGYVKNVIKVKDRMLPTFTMPECLSYFTKILAKINPNKVFNIPNWIPLLSDPTIEFNLDPPTYQQMATTKKRYNDTAIHGAGAGAMHKLYKLLPFCPSCSLVRC